MPSPLLGLWRLVRFEVWDDQGSIVLPKGSDPVGFAVFDASGAAIIQLAPAATLAAGAVPADEAERVAQAFACYVGSFEIAADGQSLTIQVQASNLPDYVGSTQIRPWKVEGDVLTLGVPGQYRATLVRALAD